MPFDVAKFEWERARSELNNVAHEQKDSAFKVRKNLPDFPHSFIDISGRLICIENGKYLGFGAFGKVKLCKTETDEYFALKIESYNHILGDEVIKSCKKVEQKILHDLGCFYGSKPRFRDKQTFDKYGHGIIKDKFYTLQKLYPGMNLLSAIKICAKDADFYLKNFIIGDNKAIVALQAAQQLKLLHDLGYLHCDIKPANFMVYFDNNTVKLAIIDFGLAEFAYKQTDRKKGHVKGTIYYLAPEILDKQPYSRASDIYALGVMFKKDLKITGALVESMLNKKFELRPSLEYVITKIKEHFPTELRIEDDPQLSVSSTKPHEYDDGNLAKILADLQQGNTKVIDLFAIAKYRSASLPIVVELLAQTLNGRAILAEALCQQDVNQDTIIHLLVEVAPEIIAKLISVLKRMDGGKELLTKILSYQDMYGTTASSMLAIYVPNILEELYIAIKNGVAGKEIFKKILYEKGLRYLITHAPTSLEYIIPVILQFNNGNSLLAKHMLTSEYPCQDIELFLIAKKAPLHFPVVLSNIRNTKFYQQNILNLAACVDDNNCNLLHIISTTLPTEVDDAQFAEIMLNLANDININLDKNNYIHIGKLANMLCNLDSKGRYPLLMIAEMGLIDLAETLYCLSIELNYYQSVLIYETLLDIKIGDSNAVSALQPLRDPAINLLGMILLDIAYIANKRKSKTIRCDTKLCDTELCDTELRELLKQPALLDIVKTRDVNVAMQTIRLAIDQKTGPVAEQRLERDQKIAPGHAASQLLLAAPPASPTIQPIRPRF